MDWQDLLTAIALYLVLEGVIPFSNPRCFKSVAARLSQLQDAQVRVFGVASMVLGVLLLYFVR